MSEYQSYRFERVVGYLDAQQHQQLRQISSRAEITATSFQVHYNYAGLKAEPLDVMLNYFDVGLYYADWGAIDSYIKLPAGTIPAEFLAFDSFGLTVRETADWQLLILSIEQYEDYFGDTDAAEFFSHLLSLRRELMQGDWRLLYFMWLTELEVDSGKLTAIPLLKFNFSKFTPAQLTFAALYDIPLVLAKAVDLLSADKLKADKSSEPVVQSEWCLDDWLRSLTDTDKNNLLATLMMQGQLTRQQALAITQKITKGQSRAYQHWLLPELIKPYLEQAQQLFEREQAAALAEQLALEKAKKEKELQEIFNQRDHYWLQAQTHADRGCASGYDQAARNVQQLDEAYQFKGEKTLFARLLADFLTKNHSRKALLKRLLALY